MNRVLRRLNFWAALVLLASPGLNQSQSAETNLSGQLKAGETTYFLNCAMCHGDHLEGFSAPALRGEDFRSTFGGLPFTRLTDFIREQMPEDRPGSLSDQEVLDVAAYLLSQNRAELPDVGLGQPTLSQPVLFSKDTP